MKREQWYVSTIAADADELAERSGLGLEIAEFCTAWNMDERFSEVEEPVNAHLRAADRFCLHAPFNELFPAAIDPKAVELMHFRLNQAAELAERYGARRVIVHSGYLPVIYFKSWYTERAVLFFKAFLRDKPDDLLFLLENVLEDEPELLFEVVRQVNDPRLRLCLDIGHAHCESEIPVIEWLRRDADLIAHFHIHNNDRSWDLHRNIPEGTIDIGELLREADRLCPEATYTIETMEARASAEWLAENGFI